MPTPIQWEFQHNNIIGQMTDDGVMEFQPPTDGPIVMKDHPPTGLAYEVLESEVVGDVEHLKKIKVHAFAVGPSTQ